MFSSFESLFASPVFETLARIYDVIAFFAFIWGPLLSIWLAQHLWKEYRQMQFMHKNYQFILLEMRIPRIIDKTPLAMELALQPFFQGKNGNWLENWWDGFVRPWFSLEIVSIEGNIKFYMYIPKKFKKTIEASVYAQYPNIEIHEVPDYVFNAPYLTNKKDWEIYGCNYLLSKPDPYPIKTYVDYGLDSTQTKEEQKSDPLSSLIEMLGTLGRGQQMWLQIMIKATEDRFKVSGSWFKKQNWKEEGRNVVKELQEKYAGETGMKATKRQSEIISAIERSLGKPGFDCGIRSIYITRKENFDSSFIPIVRSMFNPFGTQDLNGIRSSGIDKDYPWEDYNDILLNKRKHKIFDAYVKRSYFYSPYKKKPFVLNTEELATIFHFPGGVTQTPTFTRIESRKGEPPANLPI